MTKTNGRRGNRKHFGRVLAPGSDVVRAGKTPQKLTKHAWARIHEEHNYDPLAAAVQVARGEALTKDHPFLPRFNDTLADWKKRIVDGRKIEEKEIDALQKKGNELLTDSWVSHELRSKHILELLQYIYPKRKAVEMKHSGNIEMDMELKPMTATEIKTFDATFEAEY